MGRKNEGVGVEQLLLGLCNHSSACWTNRSALGCQNAVAVVDDSVFGVDLDDPDLCRDRRMEGKCIGHHSLAASASFLVDTHRHPSLVPLARLWFAFPRRPLPGCYLSIDPHIAFQMGSGV